MQWRALVLLWTGLAMIYLVSLLQEIPYPHPAKLFIPPTSSTRQRQLPPPDATILTVSNTHIYHTSIWFDLSPKDYSLRLGSGPFSNGGLGYLQQQRQKLSVLLTNSSELSTAYSSSLPNWELMHDHVLNGPISLYSSPGNGGSPTTDLQFAILYHVLNDDHIQHWIRIYYFSNDHNAIFPAGLEFKDVLLPGSTWISSFSLESNAILYSRDPDWYRFRWVTLPDHFTSAPHSENADAIILTQSEPGDNNQLFQQVDAIEEHQGLISRMYSPTPGAMQVFTLNAYKTQFSFYVQGVIAENATTNLDHSSKNQWVGRKAYEDDIDVFSHETLEYMAIVDGVHIQHERIQLDMPDLFITRSHDAKVIVMSSINYPLVSWSYSDGTDLSKINFNTSPVAAGLESNIWIQDRVMMDEMDGDLKGLQLDDTGHYLAAWTSRNEIFIFIRQKLQSLQLEEKDNQLEYGISLDEERLESWILSRVITKTVGQLTDSIGAVAFITTNNNSNYIMVGLNNGVIQSYSLDKTEIQEPIDIWSFLVEQWHIWLPMSFVVILFVISENQQASIINNVQ
ncbi:uncharacterized protein BX664DRAFT_333657 [Halteromyces radiatus]|uniref:uncharacterized protein n=1 Tax=Halteromyces radiatus TaxID=101107 RepID=UPI0022200D06|nr:uncharacterized protein BX664DRAFT_333657 [Halteromyces radiatus]KAI8089692.1 hypothetical protein BX664DRAFT_333657 [Halteromyces radiatus]